MLFVKGFLIGLAVLSIFVLLAYIWEIICEKIYEKAWNQGWNDGWSEARKHYDPFYKSEREELK